MLPPHTEGGTGFMHGRQAHSPRYITGSQDSLSPFLWKFAFDYDWLPFREEIICFHSASFLFPCLLRLSFSHSLLLPWFLDISVKENDSKIIFQIFNHCWHFDVMFQFISTSLLGHVSYYICLSHVCHRQGMEVRGRFVEVGSLLWLHESQDWI